jgi:L-fuculose-phosphate aldolase
MQMISEPAARKEMIEVGRKVYENGYVVATDGNLSYRLGRGRFLVTRSGVNKGMMIDRDLVVCDQDGEVIRGGRISSEVLLHLAAYRLRSDVQAVIHAHPPTAIAFTLAGISLEEALLPEVIMSLGKIPTSLFAAPASPEGAEVIRNEILNHDAVILDRHGSVTVGNTLWDAYFKLERLEFAAKVTHLARALGEVRKLSADEMEQVQKSLNRYKAGVAKRCPQCGGPVHERINRKPEAEKPDRTVWADHDWLAPLVKKVIEEGRM